MAAPSFWGVGEVSCFGGRWYQVAKDVGASENRSRYLLTTFTSQSFNTILIVLTFSAETKLVGGWLPLTHRGQLNIASYAAVYRSNMIGLNMTAQLAQPFVTPPHRRSRELRAATLTRILTKQKHYDFGIYAHLLGVQFTASAWRRNATWTWNEESSLDLCRCTALVGPGSKFEVGLMLLATGVWTQVLRWLCWDRARRCCENTSVIARCLSKKRNPSCTGAVKLGVVTYVEYYHRGSASISNGFCLDGFHLEVSSGFELEDFHLGGFYTYLSLLLCYHSSFKFWVVLPEYNRPATSRSMDFIDHGGLHTMVVWCISICFKKVRHLAWLFDGLAARYWETSPGLGGSTLSWSH